MSFLTKKLKTETIKHKKREWRLKPKAMMLSDKDTSARLEMISNRELNVEGCKGVAEYTDVFISLRLKKGMLNVAGRNLDVSLFEEDNICIKGIISSVEFCV